MMLEVRDQLRPLTAEVGIEVVDVRIKRTDLLPEVSQQTFERMRAERLAEAAQLRARGTELAARIRAEADREAVVTVAEAQRQADILRGQGDAERSRVFADAYQRDPSFFEFYRSMQAYEQALPANNTSLVLSPNSEFFRFFRNQLPTASGAGATMMPALGEAGSSDETPPASESAVESAPATTSASEAPSEPTAQPEPPEPASALEPEPASPAQ